MSLVDHESSFQVDFPLNVAFEATVQYLKTLREYTVDRTDTIQHKISIKAGVSLFSWGENITITFKEYSPSKTEISILSTPKTGLSGAFDMGKNRKNIDKIMQVISDALQNVPRNQTAFMGKEFKFVCPHCGQHLKCPAELDHVECECPNCNSNIIPTR